MDCNQAVIYGKDIELPGPHCPEGVAVAEIKISHVSRQIRPGKLIGLMAKKARDQLAFHVNNVDLT